MKSVKLAASKHFTRRFAAWVDKVDGQNAAARLLGMHQGHVRKIVLGAAPRQSTIEKIISASGLPASYWFDESEELEQPTESQKELRKGVNAQRDDFESFDDDDAVIEVPILSVRASAGPGQLVDHEGRVGGLFVPRSLLRELGAKPASVHLIETRGDSMQPTIADGALVMIDTAQSRARDDGIYAVRIGLGEDAEARLKRLKFRASGGVDLISDNPLYPSETLTDLSALSIIGRAVWKAEKL